MKAYVVKENYGFGRIIGVVTDEEVAKRYCRDMENGRNLQYIETELDALEIPKEILYNVCFRGFGNPNNPAEFFKEVLENNEVDALVIEETQFDLMMASLLTFQMDPKEHVIRFWIKTSNAPSAKRIAKAKLNSYKREEDDFEFMHYYPTASEERKFKYYRHG